MDIGDVTFEQYARDLRRTYWLKLMEQQANGNVSATTVSNVAVAQAARK